MQEVQLNNNPVKKTKWRKWFFMICGTLLLLFIAYVYICGITYSSGTRTGIVIKTSQKGYVFKTYEGELNLGGVSEGDGTIMPNRLWAFSIQKNDTATYNRVVHTQGKHVRLHYDEVIKHFFWQSETPYMVNKVEIVN